MLCGSHLPLTISKRRMVSTPNFYYTALHIFATTTTTTSTEFCVVYSLWGSTTCLLSVLSATLQQHNARPCCYRTELAIVTWKGRGWWAAMINVVCCWSPQAALGSRQQTICDYWDCAFIGNMSMLFRCGTWCLDLLVIAAHNSIINNLLSE